MSITIYWFRQDLRLSDNPGFVEANKIGNILPIYILDEYNLKECKMGSASKVWLHKSLESLNKSLNGKLLFLKGDAREIINNLIEKYNVKSLIYNRCYEPLRIKRDKEIKLSLVKKNINVKSFNGCLLWEPWENLKDNGTPYKVFTPYYKNALKKISPRYIIKKPESINFAKIDIKYNDISYLNLLPKSNWYKKIIKSWDISEKGALDIIYNFRENGINDYKNGRNYPAKKNSSSLSAYIHFGQISPNQIWHIIRFHELDENIEHFCSEIGWREFSYNLLYHFPNIPNKNLKTEFDNFPWSNNKEYIQMEKIIIRIPNNRRRYGRIVGNRIHA